MNVKCWIGAAIAVFVTLFALEFVIHGMLLRDVYMDLVALWRPEAEMKSMMWLMWLGYAIFSPFFVWIYAHGVEARKSGAVQGLKFGFVLGLGLAATNSLGWYVILPIPTQLMLYWFAAGVAEFTLMGLVAGLIYKKS